MMLHGCTHDAHDFAAGTPVFRFDVRTIRFRARGEEKRHICPKGWHGQQDTAFFPKWPLIAFHGNADATVNVANATRLLHGVNPCLTTVENRVEYMRPTCLHCPVAGLGRQYGRGSMGHSWSRARVGGRQRTRQLHGPHRSGCECRNAALLP
ncbi:hypothetical protein [Paraburkholderia sp. WSM4177]|uniref:hypothetical protein n=1 Tax=Paraburkholderia sp. WSM4177 TaxID=2723098 RepID=UPI00288B413A|nr:hypothetical protein [Paraburkholderia sp. WSM4177]